MTSPSSKGPEVVLAFDIYGTLLDTSAVSSALAEHFDLDATRASAVGALWRRYQLEYTWRLNSMNVYEPFDVVTKHSLLHALAESGLTTSEGSVASLMQTYDSLQCFPDAADALKSLKTLAPRVKCVVFSNGTEKMVTSALTAAHIVSLPSAIYVADSVRRYKPAPEIYHGLVSSLGMHGRDADVVLVSGNPFDVTGARAAGLSAIWVDRARNGWVDNLPPRTSGTAPGFQEPTVTVHGLGETLEIVKGMLERESK